MIEIRKIGHYRFAVVRANIAPYRLVGYVFSRHYTKEEATQYLQEFQKYGHTKLVIREIPPKGEVNHG